MRLHIDLRRVASASCS
ncbi:putative leader peptide [Saccharopolyspora rosea]|uniref:Leader peptide n=1 Tax=Saccharopolyspora rosea TaxID=524884 RepID=A0ABW3FUM1_9PSEU